MTPPGIPEQLVQRSLNARAPVVPGEGAGSRSAGVEAPVPSRAAGLQRLSVFVPAAATYAQGRSRVAPPHDRVSRLSPYLSHRLVLESETIDAVLAAHPPAAVETFVAEVLWRTYWKGWLQLRPQVWRSYVEQWRRDRDGLDGAMAERLAAALGARTGIDCFDAWARELTDTGYLHNHARLWLASIWIFTLRLPWTLGAAFFLRHLLDGDPSSNTLSWRWVAGLHTRGKHYLARAENIARHTEGRFDPRGLLDEGAGPLSEPPLDADLSPLADRTPPDPGLPSGLLLTPEDATPERSPLAGLTVRSVAGGWDQGVTGALDLAPAVESFARAALGDTLVRAASHFGVPAQDLREDDWSLAVEDWARGQGLRQVVTLEAPVGPWAERLCRLDQRLAPLGIGLVQVRRPWDTVLWPGATHGYFRFHRYAQSGGRLSSLIAALSPPRADGRSILTQHGSRRGTSLAAGGRARKRGGHGPRGGLG